jgi:hypothetical protein
VIKAEIEADIAALLRVAAEAYVSETECQAAGRAASRLREMLSKLDGPAEGYERVWIEVGRRASGAIYSYTFFTEDDARDGVDGETVALVVADIPKQRVPLIEGAIAREEGR